MRLNKQQIDKIGSLHPGNIRTYLETHGWELYQTYPENDASVWIKGDVVGRLLHDPNQYADYTELPLDFSSQSQIQMTSR